MKFLHCTFASSHSLYMHAHMAAMAYMQVTVQHLHVTHNGGKGFVFWSEMTMKIQPKDGATLWCQQCHLCWPYTSDRRWPDNVRGTGRWSNMYRGGQVSGLLDFDTPNPLFPGIRPLWHLPFPLSPIKINMRAQPCQFIVESLIQTQMPPNHSYPSHTHSYRKGVLM